MTEAAMCDLGGLFPEKQRFQSVGAVHHPLRSVPVQRDYEPVDSPDHCRGIVCAEPYSDFVSKRKMISPQEVTIC